MRNWVAPAIFLVCWTLTTHGKYSVSGDEPHYLMVSHSLWTDGDLDLSNNYRNNDARWFGASGLEMGQHVRESRGGRLLPVHDIGVPVTLLPIYAVATTVAGVSPETVLKRFRMDRGLFAYSLISLCIIGIVVAAATTTRRGLMDLGAPPLVSSGIVVALWLSPPVLSNSFLVFPEAFALLTTAVAVRVSVGDSPRFDVAAVRLAGLLGLLPWFHRKYAVYAAALLVAVLWQQRTRLKVLEPAARALVLASFVIPQIALAMWTWRHWGNLGGPLVLDGVPFSWDAFRAGALGLLVDRENGLLVWAPVYLLLPAACALAGRRYAVWLVPATALYVMSAGHDQWWGGFSPAGRFLVPLVPVFAAVGAVALKNKRFGYACLILVLPQLFISADGWQHTRSLWPQGDGHNRVLADLLRSVGTNEMVMPSLRTSSAEMAKAVYMVCAVLAANVFVWAGASRGASSR